MKTSRRLSLSLSLFSLPLLVLFAAAFFLSSATPAEAQIGNVTLLFFPGAPSGACGATQQAMNTSNGAFYICQAGSWLQVSSGGAPAGCTIAAGVLTCTGFATNSSNGGITGTEGTCAGLTAAVGVDLLCPSSTSGPLSSHGWLVNINNGGWQPLGAYPDLTDVSGVSLTSAVPIYHPVGSAAAPSISFTGLTKVGFYHKSLNTWCLNVVEAGDTCDYWYGGGGFQLVGGTVLGWSSSLSDASSADTGFSRQAADIVNCGNGINADTTCRFRAAAFMSLGTKFTTNNGCTDGANQGGATAGYFVVGSTSCTEIITMGNSATAPNGWDCHTFDLTTLADVTNPHQTATSTTTATIVTGTVVSGDKISFSCIGY